MIFLRCSVRRTRVVKGACSIEFLGALFRRKREYKEYICIYVREDFVFLLGNGHGVFALISHGHGVPLSLLSCGSYHQSHHEHALHVGIVGVIQ